MRAIYVLAALAAFASSCAGCSCTPMPAPITVSPDALPAGVVGTPYAADFTSPDGRAPVTFVISAGDLPNGLTLTNEGHLSGTPVTDATSHLTVRATDASGAVGTRDYELVIAPTPITIAPAVLADAIRGVSYLAQVSGSGGVGGYTFTLESGGLPPGLTMSSTGVISGRAQASGVFTFTLHAVDAIGHQGSGGVRLRVIDPMIAVTPSALPSGKIGLAYSQALDASGGMDPYTFALDTGALPSGLSLSSAGVISGVPATAGVSNFSITVTDANANVGMFAFTITVGAQAITITPASLSAVTVGTAVAVDFGATGGTAPYTFSISAGTVPGLTLASNGHLSGMPITIGASTFNVRALDSVGASAERTFTLDVIGATLTLLPATLPSARIGVAYSQQLSTTGGSAPYLYVIASGALPIGLTLSSGGLLSGTPSAAGTSTFSIRSVDTFASEVTRSYSLTTSTITLAPATLPAGVVGTPYSQTITATGGQAPYTFSTLDPLPPGLTLSSGGLLSGTPVAAQSSTFTVRATDALGTNGAQTYLVDVTNAPTGIVISPATLPVATVGAAYSAQLSASGGTAPYAYSLNGGTLPAGLALSTAGLISGTPTSLAIPQTFRVLADDGTLNATITYTLEVRAADGGLTGTGTCAAAFSGGALPFTATNAIGGTGVDDSLCSAAATSGGELTWRFVVDGGTRLSATVTVLDGGLQPVISVRRDACDPTGFAQACAMAGSARETTRVVADGLGAGVYFVTVDSEQLTSGVFRLDVALSTPAVDATAASCATPASLTLTSGALDLEATTEGATDDGLLGACATSGNPDRNYLYTAPATGQTAAAFSAWTLEELGGNVALGLRAGCDGGVECFVSPGNGLALGGAARITGTFDAGTSTQVWVDTLTPLTPGATLPFHLRVREAPVAAATVGECSGTSPLLTPNTSYSGSTLGLTSHFGNPGSLYSGGSCSTSGHAAADTFFRYVAPATGTVTFRVEPERGVDLSLVALTACDSSTCVAIADPLGVEYAPGEPFSLPVPVTLGQALFIGVDTSSMALGQADQGGFIISASQP